MLGSRRSSHDRLRLMAERRAGRDSRREVRHFSHSVRLDFECIFRPSTAQTFYCVSLGGPLSIGQEVVDKDIVPPWSRSKTTTTTSATTPPEGRPPCRGGGSEYPSCPPPVRSGMFCGQGFAPSPEAVLFRAVRGNREPAGGHR